ncbi:T9SS C-terminal target domain-containing protein [bacterium]|nr:MAG: T9SS C-terminal target domain-containing protein [bacterium]
MIILYIAEQNKEYMMLKSSLILGIILIIGLSNGDNLLAQGAGYALDFEGLNDFVSVADDNSLDVTNAITLEAWVKGEGADFSVTQRTTTSFSKYELQLQVVGDKIYYVWYEYDGSVKFQIWTAEMDTDGTDWSETKRTTSSYDKYAPQLQVVGDKIYYVWYEYDGSKCQIWTASMDADGTGWSATERTTSSYDKEDTQFQVVGTKIYYVWREWDGSYDQIWTASMDTNGNNWSAEKRTTSIYSKYNPQIQVVGDKIYYVAEGFDASASQVLTAKMDTDGSNWSATEKTTGIYNKDTPQLQVVGDKIYYVWHESDGSKCQIWSAIMDTDGTGWEATKRTNTSYDKYAPQLQVVGTNIYYAWHEKDANSDKQIWTAEMTTGGTGWSSTKRTTGIYDKDTPQLQVVGTKIYYVCIGYSTDERLQIWTAEMGSNILSKGDFYGLGIMGNSVKVFIDAGVDGYKFKGSAINYTAGVTVEEAIGKNWNHVSMTYDKSNLKLFVNGVLEGTSPYTEAINTNSFKVIIGDDMVGRIDEVRIWNVVRTETEIRTNMCKELAGNESGLVAYYKMTDGSGTSLTDNSTNSNTGTLTNMDDSDWVISGASIGDASTYDYSTPSSVNLASGYGDNVTVGTIDGSPDGVQIYRVDSAPNVTTPPAGLDQLSQLHYFGVFVVGGTSPTYTITYNYDGHPGISDEDNLKLASRSNNAEASWTDLNANLNTTNNTLIKIDQTGTEYILGSTSGNTLPIELSIFTAQFIENTPTLYWKTQSETDNMGWFVYRNEENNFITSEKISEFIEGHGTTTQQQLYVYEDQIQNPEVGDTYYYWLESIDYSGIINHYDNVAILIIPDQPDPGSGIIPEPEQYGLFQNEPNPVISSTRIAFNLPETEQVELAIYNLKGQLVKSLYSGVTSSKTLVWDGKDESGNDLHAGVYLYRLLIDGKTAGTKKLILIK